MNSHILKSEAPRIPSDDESLQDDLPMEMSAFPENGDNPIEIQSLDRINDDKECARVGEFVSTLVLNYNNKNKVGILCGL